MKRVLPGVERMSLRSLTPAQARERLGLLLRRVHWPVLISIPPLAAALGWGVTSGALPLTKEPLETAAVIVTGAFAAVCLARFAHSREAWFLWATAVMLTLMTREIRYPGASGLVYVALTLLAWVALARFDAFRARLTSPLLLDGLAFGFASYALAVMIDQRWWNQLPYERIWHVPVEETLELTGHLIIGAVLAWSPRSRD